MGLKDWSSDHMIGVFDDATLKIFITELKKKYGKKLQVRKDPDGWHIETGKYVNDATYNIRTVPFNPTIKV